MSWWASATVSAGCSSTRRTHAGSGQPAGWCCSSLRWPAGCSPAGSGVRRPRRRRLGPKPPLWQRPTRVRAVPGRRDWTREELAAGVQAGDRRALARTISLVEDGDPLAYGVVADIYPQTGSTYSVGVTGPPGVGKSSLVSALIRHVRDRAVTVGVVSVDPSSPFSHGALLGDRIRLSD